MTGKHLQMNISISIMMVTVRAMRQLDVQSPTRQFECAESLAMLAVAMGHQGGLKTLYLVDIAFVRSLASSRRHSWRQLHSSQDSCCFCFTVSTVAQHPSS